LLCALAPAFAEQPPQRQVLVDAVEAANWQLRLNLFHDQLRAGQASKDAVQKSEQETAAAISRLRGKWTGTPYLSTFDTTFQRSVKNPAYRDQVLSEQSPGAPQSSSAPWSFGDIVTWIIRAGIGGAILVGLWMIGKLLGHEKPAAPPQPQTSDTYGSAAYAEPVAGIPDQLYLFSGVFFGKSSLPAPYHSGPFEQHHGGPICSTPQNHTVIISRTRSGKGTRVVIPTLLRYLTGSMLVIDPKGENAAVTARARQAFKQTIHIINPWGELAPTFQQLGFQPSTYNPLDILDRDDPNVVATAQALAAAICPREKGGKDAYWSDSAASVLTAVLLWLTDQPGETKTLGRAREIVTRTRKDFAENYLTKMAASGAFEGAIRENAAPFIDLAAETYSGVMSNLAQHTKFLSDPQVKKATATSSFSMRDLMTKATTVYLVIPPDRMETQRTWLRLLITAGMQTYKHRTTPDVVRCMFLIDEFPALGRLDELPRDIATMSGYGVDFTLIVQGIDQLKEVYGDAHATILSNCAYKWFCNVNDLHSAEYLSKTLGKKTVGTTSKSTTLGHSAGGGSSGESTSHGETGRDLLQPNEVLNLGRDTAILLAPNSLPHYLRPIDYWQLQEAFASLKELAPFLYWQPEMKWDPNPYHRGGK
jgi:type IV secretion system protein VirD4